ncbi:hypothetical protein H9650_14250 [Psychrobacillus sp. Sa2BUA9]|uniref:Uncharacterized protein n=1 Tax=Psychrobacillus faecigallinarum TaxID=2762235 RepID=A0ABR8RC22_9BACI|nr:hypothetical protein [Psychrobacillus faecigallinarum]MBD7945284.1 hypothetical protein [Psychrobacillus faecigallinarum]
MFKRNQKIEVVPESEYTDFSHRVPGDAYATKKTVMVAAVIPAAASIGLILNRMSEANTANIIPTSAPVISPVVEPVNILAQSSTLPLNITASPEIIPTGFVADASLDMLANILDPLVQIMVAISFPIASVIMLGGAFFFMLGNSEKAWQTIFNAGLGYVIIQMSPLFLDILRSLGKAV